MYNDMRLYNCMIVHEYCFIVYFNSPHLLQVPPKVTGVSVSKAVKDGKPTLNVTWTALQNVANLLKHRIEYRHNGEFDWGNAVVAQAYSTSTLLPALLPGTEYNVRIRAVSAAGEGEWSEVHTETTFDSEFIHLHVQLCHQVTFCNITVVSVPSKLCFIIPLTNAPASTFTVTCNVVFSVSLIAI